MLDYITPFTFVFRDPHWLRKLLIASLLTCTLVGAAPVFGWTVEVVRRVARGHEPALPDLDDWGHFWRQGGRFALVNALWLLPMLFVTLLLYVVPALLIHQLPDVAVLLVFTVILVIVLGFLIIYGLFYMFFLQPMMVALAYDNSVWQSANPLQLWHLVRPRFLDYLLVFILIWLTLINLLFMLSSFTLFLLLPAALVYGGLVTAHFTGQLGKKL